MTVDAGAPSQPSRGRAARRGFAALLAGQRPQVPDALDPVLRAHRVHHPNADAALLGRAYQLAEASHRGQFRKSGEPYITHPLAVTLILAQLGAETTTLVAALLHDTVEDTDVTLEQVEAAFGAEVAYLVDGVTKLEKVDFGAAAEAETFRKMLVATGNDVRVMVIKLADRLHNMRTIRHMKPASQVRIAKVTRDVLIPLAERLGIQVVKTELEDIVFATLHPQEYAETAALVAGRAADTAHGGDPLSAFVHRLRRQLREARIPAEVSVRSRHCVSVHRVRLARGSASPLAPSDFARVLVVVEDNADCYAVLGELHTCWTPLPGEFKDFIAAPKFNLYQSLHTAVATAEGDVAEVLVRTGRMHRVAEYGVVALGAPAQEHEAGDEGRDELDGTDPARPGWLARLLDWQRVTPDPDAFWSRLTADLSGDREITAVTGDGRTLQLPSGADCVDVAYALGEQTGHRCIGARLNGRLVALSTPLADGDVVEVLTESGRGDPSGPAPEWLGHARTPLARIAIERWLAEHQMPSAPDGTAGAAPTGCGPLPTAAVPRPPGRGAAGPEAARRHRPVDAGPARAAAPEAAARAVPREAPARTGPRHTAGPAVAQTAEPVTDIVRVQGRPGAPVRLARCCTPVPPDTIRAFTVRGGTVAVHRSGCPTAAAMAEAGHPVAEVAWADAGGPTPAGYRATLHVEALGRPRLLAEITAALAAAGVDILSAVVEPPRELRVSHTYTVALPSAKTLPTLMRAVLRVPGVYDVNRDVGGAAESETGGPSAPARGRVRGPIGDAGGRGAAPEDGTGTDPASPPPAPRPHSAGDGDGGSGCDGGKQGDREAAGVRPSSGIRGRSAALTAGSGVHAPRQVP